MHHDSIGIDPAALSPRSARTAHAALTTKRSLIGTNPVTARIPTLVLTALLACTVCLAACTPTYDWRDVRGDKVPFTVLLPAKPSVLSRQVNLGGIQANMTMTAAEIADVTFAVGTAELPDAAQAQAALQVMKATLVKNIGGTIRHEKSELGKILSSIELDAAAPGGSAARVLHARLVARERRVYQAIVIGPAKAVRQEAVDTFLTSFKTE